jgi:hypothetical protein
MKAQVEKEISIDKSYIIDSIGIEDSGEFTFKTFFCHMAPLFFKVSNRGTQYVEFRKSVNVRSERGFDPENG